MQKNQHKNNRDSLFAHYCRLINKYEITLREHQQITFVTLNRFYPISNPPAPCFLTDNIKPEGIPTKIK